MAKVAEKREKAPTDRKVRTIQVMIPVLVRGKGEDVRDPDRFIWVPLPGILARADDARSALVTELGGISNITWENNGKTYQIVVSGTHMIVC